MDLNDLRVFLGVAPRRSMSEAAADLKLSVPTIARRLDALERAAGVRLVKRTPRGLVLTEQGALLAERSAPFLESAAGLERFLAELKRDVRPPFIRVSATEPVIAEILAPRLGALWAAHPTVRVELRVQNQLAEIALNEADVAIRLSRPTTKSLMARRLRPLEIKLYGSPSYVASLADDRVLDLSRAELLSFDDAYGPIPERVWIDRAGLAGQVRARMSSTRGLVAAVAAGQGIAMLPAVLAEKAGLVALERWPELTPAPRDVWIVWHKDLNRNKAVKAVVGWIGEGFGAARTSRR
jgi:DNA-binding transcriptional LysR family regulator